MKMCRKCYYKDDAYYHAAVWICIKLVLYNNPFILDAFLHIRMVKLMHSPT